MIKKLRRRIILVNMLLVGIVILLIFTVVCVNSYSNSVHELERGLTMVAEKEGFKGNQFGENACADTKQRRKSPEQYDWQARRRQY